MSSCQFSIHFGEQFVEKSTGYAIPDITPFLKLRLHIILRVEMI